MSLSWTGSTDNVAVTGYDVYVNSETTPRDNSDYNLSDNYRFVGEYAYAFKVRAKDAVPNYSAYSNTVNVTTDEYITFSVGDCRHWCSGSNRKRVTCLRNVYRCQDQVLDIWGTADEFRYVYQSISGDFTVTARLSSLTNTDPWAKAGVMVREGTAADARHALTAVTISNGLAFQRRATGWR